jgi:hypothetical protein
MSRLQLTLNGFPVEDAKESDERYFVILREYLQPDSTISAEDAAKSIDKLTPSPKNPVKQPGGNTGPAKDLTDSENHLWDFWGVVDACAKQIPHNHPSQDRLIKLVEALRNLPETRIRIWVSNAAPWNPRRIPLGHCGPLLTYGELGQ